MNSIPITRHSQKSHLGTETRMHLLTSETRVQMRENALLTPTPHHASPWTDTTPHAPTPPDSPDQGIHTTTPTVREVTTSTYTTITTPVHAIGARTGVDTPTTLIPTESAPTTRAITSAHGPHLRRVVTHIYHTEAAIITTHHLTEAPTTALPTRNLVTPATLNQERIMATPREGATRITNIRERATTPPSDTATQAAVRRRIILGSAPSTERMRLNGEYWSCGGEAKGASLECRRPYFHGFIYRTESIFAFRIFPYVSY